ncbi:RT0821/Lpp0805 family surface protein [Paraburkholderia sp. ZP32-5]|uniref:RT0821/Lpp0805 family surface protein n=1 Tax=Paraburkholderia sp. ZP32-5 TaxID=2883245 RepID=UPI001EFF2198|nr:RT0821/Lpp0805 family surface protein [Paraburkholderia sp. ZP32-5]
MSFELHPARRVLRVLRVLSPCFAGLALAAGAASSYATNLNFLNNTPITYMRDADRQALNAAAQKALETGKDGETFQWSNAGTGNPVQIGGTVTPRDVTKEGGQTCRQVTLVANAKGQTQTWTPTACKTGNGLWKILRQ